MLNQRIEAARPIAEKIHEVEQSLNATMLQMGELMSSIAAARLAPGTRFSLTAGIDATDNLIEAASNTARSYKEVVVAHEHLAADRNDAGLGAVSWGPAGCPPEVSEATPDKTVQLKAVANS